MPCIILSRIMWNDNMRYFYINAYNLFQLYPRTIERSYKAWLAHGWILALYNENGHLVHRFSPPKEYLFESDSSGNLIIYHAEQVGIALRYIVEILLDEFISIEKRRRSDTIRGVLEKRSESYLWTKEHYVQDIVPILPYELRVLDLYDVPDELKAHVSRKYDDVITKTLLSALTITPEFNSFKHELMECSRLYANAWSRYESGDYERALVDIRESVEIIDKRVLVKLETLEGSEGILEKVQRLTRALKDLASLGAHPAPRTMRLTRLALSNLAIILHYLGSVLKEGQYTLKT